MSKALKFLYEFTVDKEVEKKVEEKKTDESGQEITITRTEKVKEPVKFGILKPGRRLYDLAEIFLAKTISDYVKEGLMPITLVAKRFGNDGGVLTEAEIKYIEELQSKMDEDQKKLIDLKIDDPESKEKNAEERTKILSSMLTVQSEIDKLRNSYISLYENTAEMKARKKAIEWWVTHLAYNGGENPTEMFPEQSFLKRYEKYIDVLDGDDVFLRRAANKATYLISTWFSAGNGAQNMTKEDFLNAEQHFDQNFKEEENES